MHNRRRSARQRIHSPVYAGLKPDSSETLPDLNEIFNISIRGTAFQSPKQLSPGQQLDLRLDFFETGESIEAKARVVWSEPSGRTGVRFRRLPTPLFHQLREWLFFNLLVACAHYSAAQARKSPAETADAAVEPPTSILPAPGEADEARQPVASATLTTLADLKRVLIARELGSESALHLLAERARLFTGATGAAIALASGAEMVCRASAGSTAPCIGTRFQAEAGLSGECVRRGVTLRCDDSDTDARVERESCQALGIRSILASPLRAGDFVIGLVEVFSEKPHAFSTGHGAFLEGLAEIAVAAVGPRSSVPAHATAVQETPELARDAPATSFDFGGEGGQTSDALETSALPSSSHLRTFLIVVAVAALMFAAVVLLPAIRSRLNGFVHASPQASAVPTAVQRQPKVPATPLGNDMDRLRQLAEQGDAAAQFAMGAHYAVGDGVPQDYATAARWFARAANQGHVPAQATLGAYYWAGTGVPKDLDKAYFWSVLAQAGGDEASKYRVAALASSMSRRQVIEAQEEANEWLKSRQTGGQGAALSAQ